MTTPDKKEKNIFKILWNLYWNKNPMAIKYKVGILVALVVIIVLVGTFALGGFGERTDKLNKVTDLGLKNIGELATQAGYFTSVQTISNARELWGVEIPLTRNKFIYSYDGTIKAGIDFEAVKIDVDEKAKKVTVTLPEAKILSTAIDENSFEIFDESNNIFNPIGLNDMNKGLLELKKAAEQKALKNGILENARTNAKLLIKGFLIGVLNSDEYTFVFK